MCYPSEDVDSGGGCINIYVGEEGSWEISVSSSQFCYEPKTALKMRSIFKKGLIFFSFFLLLRSHFYSLEVS